MAEKITWGTEIGEDNGMKMYRSFTYRGVEYSLYDCVYFYRGGLEADIGKIVLIWETAEEKKVKVLWFFRPTEIFSFLKDYRPRCNELFLACGVGKGLSNIVSLEAIDGKCNVICISKDSRNTLPSNSDMMSADYVFSHVFYVDKQKLTKEIPDRIGPVKVERLLNRARDKPKASVERQTVVRAGSHAEGNKVKMESVPVEEGAAIYDQLVNENKPIKRVTFELPPDHLLKKRKVEPTAGSADVKISPLDAERWLGKSTWEEKICRAHEQRRLVTLINLDPSFTSSEIQEMIFSLFKLKVEAKIIPRRCISGPLDGEALVIFGSRDDANYVISELRQKCLVDGEGRPIVAFKTKLIEPQSSSSFPGHISLVKKEKMRRSDKAKAVSTSHCVQGNTSEYDMSIQWSVLQLLWDQMWKTLHERQAEETSLLLKRLQRHQIKERTAPTEATPRHTAPTEATPRHTAPTEATPCYTEPTEATPSHTAPTEAIPRYTAPTQATPHHTAPTEATPRHSAPTEVTPIYTTPTKAPHHTAPSNATTEPGAGQMRLSFFLSQALSTV